MELDVTVQIGGEDVPAGRLYLSVPRGVETATFSYAPSYLADPRSFSLGPDMPLGPGTFHSEGLRALFSCAVGNTDNHLRNHGFLRDGAGWALSPAFDVNPTVGNGEKYLATGLGFDVRDADPRLAIEVCDYFRLGVGEARGRLAGWRGPSPGGAARRSRTGSPRLRSMPWWGASTPASSGSSASRGVDACAGLWCQPGGSTLTSGCSVSPVGALPWVLEGYWLPRAQFAQIASTRGRLQEAYSFLSLNN